MLANVNPIRATWALPDGFDVVGNTAMTRNGRADPTAFERDGRQVTWELHNEFATMTWSGPVDDWDAKPEGIGLEQHEQLLLVYVDVYGSVERERMRKVD